MINIENDYLTVMINEMGAEVRSINSKDKSKSYMWSGDPTVWDGVSPVLFPIVSKAQNDEINYLHKKYTILKHGFARNGIFKIIKHTTDSVTLLLENSQIPNGIEYPFNLKLAVTYTLIDKTLLTNFSVVNNSGIKAFFSIGAHPAFKYPFDDKHKIIDYYIEFEAPELLKQYHFNSEGLWLTDVTSVNLIDGKICLTPNIFDNDALFYSGYKSKFVSLVERGSGKKIKVSLSGFPLVGFWSKPGANFVCIEPWCGSGDRVGTRVDINNKLDIIPIEADSTWEKAYSISFEY